jgi:hypothetical protein
MRVRNRMVEELFDPCSAEAQAPSDQTFDHPMHGANKTTYELVGSSTNRPRTALTVELQEKSKDTFKATLTWVRADLAPPYKWEVTSTVTLTPQVPTTKCYPDSERCADGIDFLGDPMTLYRCDPSGTTLTLLERCPTACVAGRLNDTCE